MKKHIKKIVLALLISTTVLINNEKIIKAYTDIKFRNISSRDGLSQTTVETIIQDRKGYIWIGTNDGLNRYNGYNYKVYRKEKDSDKSLINNYIIALQEDKNGNVWVGTSDGISLISSEGKIIKNYNSEEDGGNLSSSSICEILVTEENKIYVATSDGINVYNENLDKFERIFGGKDDLTDQLIYSITFDENNNLWVGTESGLNKISLENNTVEKIYLNALDRSLEQDSVYKVYNNKDGYLWLGTNNSGAIKFNIETMEVKTYQNDANDPNSIPSNNVKNFLRDSKGKLWICTGNGLAKYKSKKDNFINYNNKVYDKSSLVDNNTFTAIEDKNGLIWLGTYGGISIFDPVNKIRKYSTDPFNNDAINDNMIGGIYEDTDGSLWIGTNTKGLNIIEDGTEKFTYINTDNSSLSNNSINDITGDDKDIFIGTNNGLNIFNKVTKEIKIISEEEGLTSNKVKNLYYDDLGYLIIGTSKGFNVLDLATNEITNITPYLDKVSGDEKYSGAIFKDSESNYWLGGFIKAGLYKLNPRDNTVINYVHDKNNPNSISDNSIRAINEDGNGNIWVGTSFGLNKLDKKTNHFESYTVENGLPNNTIYGILFDDDNNPWVSTNYGLSKFDRRENKFINLNMTDGLQSNEFNGESYYKTKDGEFLFGGINGLNAFYPNDLIREENTPDVVFDTFKVNGIEVDNINGEGFRNNNNNISFRVFLPDYKNTESIRYYYKLEDKNDDWQLMDTNEITFSNLSSGSYTLSVKARNSIGAMSEENTITFSIDRPIWASNVAILIYIMFIFIVIFHQKNKVKKLDSLVAVKTKELRVEMKKNDKLLNKVINLERNKNNYFINLSHELRTPLNVLSSTEQLISELNKSESGISREKIANYMDVERRNIKRLLNLINNIIDSSKIENGNYNLILDKHDVVYVVEEAALTMKNYIENKGITLIIDPEVEEKYILCDASEIERCIVNLVSNASNHTPYGGEIIVTIKDLVNSVCIKVKDTGIGIDPSNHKNIFNRFNQVADGHSEPKGGSGLGLTITKHLIDLHGGSIYVESEINKGSTFIINLPVNNKI
ncbi:ligand-binding sensor domain-containing protein [Clostridium paraputrificum]|uniref:ligand-binding sensor domain-containing protein n=1 Tax=Clostridium paraputrificum TaxID=29363 RepID=UPI003D349A0E